MSEKEPPATGAVILDNFNVAVDFDTAAALSAIPEPSTYATIFGGIALMSAAIHRRQRTRDRRRTA